MAPIAKPRKPVDHKKLFADRLKTARSRVGFDTAAEFAKHVGIEVETYRRWERGETEPGISSLNLIIPELKVSADYLVTGDLPPPPKAR